MVKGGLGLGCRVVKGAGVGWSRVRVRACRLSTKRLQWSKSVLCLRERANVSVWVYECMSVSAWVYECMHGFVYGCAGMGVSVYTWVCVWVCGCVYACVSVYGYESMGV